MKRIFIFIFCCSMLSLNSSGQNKNGDLNKTSLTNVVASNKMNIFYKFAKQKEKQLKIGSLESGFDSLQIRIWYDYALFNLRELIIIKRVNQAWTGLNYDLTVYRSSNKEDKETIATKRIKYIFPKNGWTNLIHKLTNFKIMTLPNMDDIPGLEDNWTDGITYSVEVATKSKYRFYSYHLPDKFEDKFPDAKNMTKILKLVASELKNRP